MTAKIHSQAGSLDIVIDQGSTFSTTMIWKDSNGTLINLTGYTARLYVKHRKSNITTVHEMTTENGGIALGGATGEIQLNISSTDTIAFDWDEGVYDLEMINGNFVTRLLEGAFIISKEVTTE